MKEDIINLAAKFEKLTEEVLRACGYFVSIPHNYNRDYDVDAQNEREHLRIECKITVNGALLFFKKYSKRRMVNVLLLPFKGEDEKYLLNALSCLDKEDWSDNLQIWDIYDLQKKLEEQYRQSPDQKIKSAFDNLSNFANKFYNINLVSPIIDELDINYLCRQYDQIIHSKSRSKWRNFENFVENFISYYFQGYIGRLIPQKVTDDNLYRYDWIAPISIEKTDSYFMEIVRNCFNTRYLVFEAKCYSNKLSQDEIWRTSKYLYKTALRSVAIIFTTSSRDNHAILTQKSLLREQGKLIIVIGHKDIKKLLNHPDVLIDEILKEKLDDLMMNIHA